MSDDHSEVSISDGLSFILDSGATKNVMSAFLCEKYGIKIKKLGNRMNMNVANNNSISIYGKCELNFPLIAIEGTKKKYVKLTVFVSYDLSMKHSYLSLSTLDDMGFYWANKHKSLYGSGDYKGYKLPISRVGGLYYTYFGNYRLMDHLALIEGEYDPADDVKIHGKSQEYWQELYDIHRILGHCSAERIIRTLKNGNIKHDKKIDLNDFRKLSCTVCKDSAIELRKHVKGSLVNISKHMMPFDYIGIDLMIASNDGEFPKTSDCSAILVMVDFKTRYKICEVLPDKKSETVANVLIDMINLVETQFDAKVKVIVSDQGNEFKNNIFENFLADHGKIHLHPTLGDSRGNNMAENSILVIQKLTRKLMNECLMITQDMWPYAARYGTMLSNYISGAGPDKVSAAAMLGIEPVKIEDICEFGIPCMVNQRSNDPQRNHVRGYFMGYSNFRSYIPQFFIPGTEDGVIDHMVNSNSYNPIGNFKRGKKYILELYEEFRNDPLAQEFAYNLNKDQPNLSIEEAGLMNKAIPKYEMKVLSANEWKKENHIDETEGFTNQISTDDLMTDEVENREDDSETPSIESDYQEHTEDESLDNDEGDEQKNHDSSTIVEAEVETNTENEHTLPTNESSPEVSSREPTVEPEEIKREEPTDPKVEDVQPSEEPKEVDSQGSVSPTQNVEALDPQGEETQVAVTHMESDPKEQELDNALSREPNVSTGGVKRKVDKANDNSTSNVDVTKRKFAKYPTPKLKYPINGQELKWTEPETGGEKTAPKFKGFVPYNIKDFVKLEPDYLAAIIDENNPFKEEKLITSIDDLNEKLIENEQDYYNVVSVMKNEDFEKKMEMVSTLLKSPQKLKKVFYNVNDNENFKEPLEKELGKLRSTGTINMDDIINELPDDAMVVELLTLFTQKRDDSFKARVCARGNVLKDKNGKVIEDTMRIDEVFMTTLRESIISHLHFVLLQGQHCAQIDIANAYLNGELPFGVFIRNPKGKGYLKLNKALYGLSISGRIWFAMIHSILISLGCECKAEGIYYNVEKDTYAMLYVDDLMITGPNKENIDGLINDINNIFELKRSECCIDGKDKYKFDYVGVQIEYERKKFMRIKCEFKEKLEALQFGSNDKINIPGDSYFKAKGKGGNTDPDKKVLNYVQRVVGLAQYVAAFRPDIAYYVNMLSVATGQKLIYKSLMKQLVMLGEYLYNTRDDYLEWKYHDNSEEIEIVCYCDASMNIEPRAGYFIYVNGNPILWKSQRIKTVCTSSAEAEINALYFACLPILFLKSWYEYVYNKKVSVKILTDATAVLDGLKKNGDIMNHVGRVWYSTRSRKISEFVKEVGIELEKIDTKINVADILTKATKREQFNRLKKFIMTSKNEDKSISKD